MPEFHGHALEIPIVQGGMGIGVSLAGLAGAVMKEGGMGTISAAHPGYSSRNPEFQTSSLQANLQALKEEIKKARIISPDKGVLAVNIMCASRDYDCYVQAAAEAGCDVIVSGAGLPLHLPALVQNRNPDIALAPVISSLRALKLVLQVWNRKYQRCPDLIIIEGPLAGGHLGFDLQDLQDETCQSLEEIVREVCIYLKDQQLNIPVIAAGGIFDHTDLLTMQQAGAYGVQLATRFIATEECDAAAAFKQKIVDCTKEDIVLVHSPAGYPARALMSPFVKQMLKENIPVRHCVACMKRCSSMKAPYCITEALIQAVKGNPDTGLFFTGARADEIHAITTVKTLVKELLAPAGSPAEVKP